MDNFIQIVTKMIMIMRKIDMKLSMMKKWMKMMRKEEILTLKEIFTHQVRILKTKKIYLSQGARFRLIKWQVGRT